MIRNGKDYNVKGLAITCIGHVVRMHLTINKEKVFPVLKEMLEDKELFGRVEDALDDMEVFLKINPKDFGF
jgi:hypothetical protein